MRYLLNEQRLTDIMLSPSYQKRFKGKHPVLLKNLDNLSDLEGEKAKFEQLKLSAERDAQRSSGRNLYVARNAALVWADYVEQLKYLIDYCKQGRR